MRHKIIFSFLGVVFGVIFLGGVSFYLGGGFLAEALIGNDAPHALSHIDYLYQYWPQKMLWQPLYGRGMSLIGINYGGFWVAAMTARILGWTPTQSMHFWQLMNMFLTSLAVFFLGWVLIGYLGGILAGFFFLLSQISWFWQARTGLFELQGALIWLPLFFLCFHRLLKAVYQNNVIQKFVFWLLSALVLCLAIWWHLVIAALVIEASFLYMLFFFLKERPSIWRRFFEWVKVVGLGVLLSSFFLIPFFFYNTQIVMGKIDYMTPQSLPFLPWLTFWGKSSEWGVTHDLWQGYFALPVLIFALLGVVLALVRKNFLILAISFISLLSSFQAAGGQIAPSLVEAFLPVFALVNIRAIIVAIIFIPIIAGFGVAKLGDLVFSKLEKAKIKLALSFLLSICVAFVALKTLDRLPANYDGRCGSSYGPEGKVFCANLADLDQNLLFLVKPSKQSFGSEPFLARIASFLPKEADVGADMTINRGEFVEGWSLVSDIPIVSSYDYVVPLDFQYLVFDALYGGKGSEGEVNQIASWFGFDYLILDRFKDSRLERFRNWHTVAQGEDIWVIKSPNPTRLGSHSNRPAIIFFGDPQNKAYFKWWELLINGGLDYSEAFIADGGARIEAYSLEELLRFKAIFLWGESYKKKDKAFELIKKYLENGGKILIDTGWQFTSPFWQKEDLPDWMPIIVTDWQSFDNWRLQSGEVDLGFEVSGWTAPKWEGKSWGVSVSKPEYLRSGAEAFIIDKNSNSILAASMKVGKGEVIWTGLNLVGMYHVNDKNVIRLTTYLLKSLIEGGRADYSYQVERIGPEKLEVELINNSNNTWFYWREASLPNWEAKSNLGLVKIYKSGPGLMLLNLPPHTTKLSIYQNYHWTTILGASLSVFSLLFVLMLMILKCRLEKKRAI